LEAAHDYCRSTPLPEEAAEPEETDVHRNGDTPPEDGSVPF
jgi:hypothetical protein